MTEIKKKREATAQQKDVSEYRGGNLIVSAGAGSGKTTVMLARIARLIEEGADIRRMLVCTFTNAAAADMRRKLTDLLTEKSKERDDTRLREALRALSSADIGTLHAFCAHCVRRWFFDCDVDPEFTVLEEGEAATLLGSAAESVVEAALERGDEDFMRLYDAMYANRRDGALRKAILQVYTYSRAWEDGFAARGACKDDESYRAALYADIDRELAALAVSVRELHTELCQAGATADATYAEALVAHIEAKEPFALTAPKCKQDAPYRDLHELLLAKKAAYKKLCERRAAVADLAPTADSLVFCRLLVDLAKATGEAYAQAKRSRGKLDYADLEHGMLRVLQGAHGREVSGAYDYVFVDEYQDINPLQEKILSYFTKSENFYVGDLKQSIYGFRMCRPEYFVRTYKAYAAGKGGAAKQLTVNFRSDEGILDFVNGFFSAAMTENFGGTEYAGEALTAGKAERTGERAPWKRGDPLPPGVRATIVTERKADEELPPETYSAERDPGDATSRALLVEADAVVREIEEILDDPSPCICENGAMRAALPRDIAVLVRSRREFSAVLERRLREHRLPIASTDEKVADEYLSVSALLSMLRLLDNAEDDVSLAAVLRSPMFGGFSTDDLVAVRAAAGEGSFCDAVRQAATREQKIASFCADIDALRDYASAHTVAEIAGHITSRYECFAAALRYEGETGAAALDAYMDHLAAMTEYDDLHGYLRFIARIGLPKLSVPAGDGIRLTTIHASKGLEYPFVILPQLDAQFNFMDARASVLCDDEEGVTMRTYDFAARTVRKNPRYAAVADRICRATAEEELRILYVAMTRAEKRLSLYSLYPFGKEDEEKDVEGSVRYIDWLYPYIRRSARILRDDEEDDAADEGKDEAAATAETIKEATADEPTAESVTPVSTQALRFAETLRARIAPVTEAHCPVKASVSGVVRREDESYPPDDVFAGRVASAETSHEGDDRAAERGSAYHLFMQWADYAAPFDPTTAFDAVAKKFPAAAALVDRAQIERAYLHIREKIAGATYYRERSFVLETDASRLYPDGGDEKVLVQGIIDLMIIEDGAVTIIDYKTGDDAHLSSPAYARQLRLYAEAVRTILRMPVRAAYLYGFDAGKFHEVDV